MNRCGCNPIQEPYEFLIDSQVPNTIEPIFSEVEDLCELKNKVICNYLGILDKLECGIQEDLEFILKDILYIYIKEKLFIQNNVMSPISYIGFSTEKDADKLKLDQLKQKILPRLNLIEQMENKEYGSYLWIVSPHTLKKVALDEGFTYEVKMNQIDYINGFHYYRSNSRLDICNLTYYIK